MLKCHGVVCMKRKSFFYSLSVLFLSSCVSRHDIEIKTQPSIMPVQNNQFFTCEPFTITVDGKLITVPKGFLTDLASIPRVFWAIDAPNDTVSIAPAILHDYMYSIDFPYNFTRKKADDIFYYALRKNGASRWTSLKFWSTVRLFGKKFYKEDLC